MTIEELQALLETLEIPVFYNHRTTKDVQDVPFIVFLDEGQREFYADDITYFETIPYLIILHTLKRDLGLEKKIKDLFTTNRIAYNLNDVDWLDDLLMWQVSFNIEVKNGYKGND